MLRSCLRLALGLAAGLWLSAGSAFALTIGPPVVTMNGVNVASYGVLVDSGVTAQWTLESYAGTGYQLDNWNVSLDEDPFVTNNFQITNTTTATQTYVATVLLPIPLFSYNAQRGSIGITVTDGSPIGADLEDGVTLSSVVLDQIYTGLVNGSSSLILLPDPSSVTCAVDGCSNVGSVNVPFGPAGPGNATSIALMLKFTLTPGDSAAITSRYDIIPEPTTAVLMGLGLAGLGFAGRRRSS